jgi:hypothetical protein
MDDVESGIWEMPSKAFSLTWYCALDSQGHRHDDHKRFIRHRINDATCDCLQFPLASHPTVYEVGDPGICE